MAGMIKAQTTVRLLIVLALLMSASGGSDAARLLRAEPAASAAAPWAGDRPRGTNGRVVSVSRVVVSKASAGASGCTYNPNNGGRRCH